MLSDFFGNPRRSSLPRLRDFFQDPNIPRKGLARERYFLVKRIEGNQKILRRELDNSPSRGHCCDWCGASSLARQVDAKLNRQYGRLAVLDLKLGIPENADYYRRWRAEMRRKHGHIEFTDSETWRKPK